jgi:hypothetical protein
MAKTCESCGRELTIENTLFFNGMDVCRDCYTKLEKEQRIAKRSGRATTAKAAPTGYQFRVLLGYGKAISSLGWIVVLMGIIGFIIGLANLGHGPGILLLAGGIIISIFGLIIVASGQIISCFVSIERNTRATQETIEKYLLPQADQPKESVA